MIFYYLTTSIFSIMFFSFHISKWKDERPDLKGFGGQ
jgi:hypothetical protein